MRLQRVEVEGLKCFGPGPTSLTLDGDSAVLIGPANAGKSTLATAVYRAIHGAFSAEEFHSAEPNSTLQVNATFDLSDTESTQLAEDVFGRHYLPTPGLEQMTWRWLGGLFTHLDYNFIATLDPDKCVSHDHSVSSPFFEADQNNATLHIRGKTSGRSIDSKSFVQLVTDYVNLPQNPNLGEFITELINVDLRSIATNQSLHNKGISLINDRFHVLSEVRVRPADVHDDAVETWEGSTLTGVLGKRFGGSDEEKSQFHEIERTFNLLMHPLTLNISRAENRWILGFKDPGSSHYIKASAVGMGTVESLLLITNLIINQDRIIVLEEPELHLHPPAQRSMQDLFRVATKRNQLLIVTHSPEIVATDGIHRIVRMQPGPKPAHLAFQGPDAIISIYPPWVREYLKDALFGRSALFVEGVYDMLTIQNILNVMFPDWQARGVVVVPVNSKKGIVKPYRFLESHGMSVAVCLDSDALSVVDNHIGSGADRVDTCTALVEAVNADIIPEVNVRSSLQNTPGVKSGEKYPEDFVVEWRDKLRDKGWLILTDTLDRLIMTAMGQPANMGSQSLKRQAADESRSISPERVPAEISELVKILRQLSDLDGAVQSTE